MDSQTQNIPDKRLSQKVEWVLILILGFLLGVAIKTEAAKRITIGFNDYKVESLRQDYDISKIQNALIEKAKSQQGADEQQSAGQEPSSDQEQPN